MSEHFGEHLMIDVYGANKSVDTVKRSLNELCDLLGVKKLSEPLVTYTPDGELKVPGGVTGVIVLAESHISIHTFPARHFLSADVYSCKHGMDQEAVANYIKENFHATDVDIMFVLRGVRYPAEDSV